MLILAVSLLSTAAYLMSLLTLSYPVDGWWPGGLFIDFKNTWFGAWTFWHGNIDVLFDRADYTIARRRFFGLEIGQIWAYPLHFLMLTLPVGLLSFPVAASLWTVGNLAVFSVFLSRIQRPTTGVALLLILVSSGFVHTIFFGQITILICVLLIGGLAVMPQRPVLAGVAFGLMTVKPHLGLLLAIFLVLNGKWLTIVAAVVTTAILLALSVLVIGVEPWLAYIHQGIPEQAKAMTEERIYWHWMPTWYATLRLYGWSREVAMAVQVAVALLWVGVLLLWRVLQVPLAEQARFLPLLTLASLPYSLPHDILLVAPLLAGAIIRPDVSLPERMLLVAVLTGPGAFAIASMLFGTPVAGPCLWIATVVLIARATRTYWYARPASLASMRSRTPDPAGTAGIR